MADPTYWLDLFTPETWHEATGFDYSVTGFRVGRRREAEKIKAGDLFLCYLTGKSRFVGVLEVLGEAYWDETPLWKSDPFPVRLKTRLVMKVPEDSGLHLHEVVAQSAHARSWSGYYRGSPRRLPTDDGGFVVKRLHELAASVELASASDEPVELSVGEDQPEQTSPRQALSERHRDHERIQHRLLKFGQDLGYQTWVAKNDRSSVHNGERLADMTLAELPVQFDDTTQRTIEFIDVLWLQGNRIEAAFEVESTTSIFSGLLRMADLLAMQPNTDIPLFIVAPDDRRAQVLREIRRPVFSSLPSPLAKACRYISFSRLERELDRLRPHTKHLKASFLNEIAETAS